MLKLNEGPTEAVGLVTKHTRHMETVANFFISFSFEIPNTEYRLHCLNIWLYCSEYLYDTPIFVAPDINSLAKGLS